MTPPYLKESLPLKCSLLFGNHNLHLYHEISCNTDRYMYSFFPDSTRSWNYTDINFQSSPSIGTFNKNIFSLIRPTPKSTFGIHDPQGIKHLLQLSVVLSPLRHKKTHNFLDTPKWLVWLSLCPRRHHALFVILLFIYITQKKTQYFNLKHTSCSSTTSPSRWYKFVLVWSPFPQALWKQTHSFFHNNIHKRNRKVFLILTIN